MPLRADPNAGIGEGEEVQRERRKRQKVNEARANARRRVSIVGSQAEGIETNVVVIRARATKTSWWMKLPNTPGRCFKSRRKEGMKSE